MDAAVITPLPLKPILSVPFCAIIVQLMSAIPLTERSLTFVILVFFAGFLEVILSPMNASCAANNGRIRWSFCAMVKVLSVLFASSVYQIFRFLERSESRWNIFASGSVITSESENHSRWFRAFSMAYSKTHSAERLATVSS